jgi:hypothetical protein
MFCEGQEDFAGQNNVVLTSIRHQKGTPSIQRNETVPLRGVQTVRFLTENNW